MTSGEECLVHLLLDLIIDGESYETISKRAKELKKKLLPSEELVEV
jgi:hypothetical protein